MEIIRNLQKAIDEYTVLNRRISEITHSATQTTPETLLGQIREIKAKQDELYGLNENIIKSLQQDFPGELKDLVDRWYECLEAVINRNSKCIPVLQSQHSLLNEELKSLRLGISSITAYGVQKSHQH